MNDECVDALTRDTLRWYVHEERDSGKVLQEAYACVESMDGGSAGSNTVSADAQALMECMSQNFATLQQSIKELVETVGKQAKSR